jgi:hypothetical protein
MTAVASVRPSKIGRIKHPRNAPYWDSAITPLLAVGARARANHHALQQKSSKVANERSKMREKAGLREVNLNGAILADAKLGGACLDEGFPRRGISAAPLTPRCE